MEIKELIDIGLTKNQAKVYLELLKFPGQNPGRLAKKLSIDRSFMYSILNSLINKGLCSYIVKETKKYFYATNPDNLLKGIEEKRSKAVGVVEKLKKISQEPSEGEIVRLYEGKAGLKAFVRDFLESDSFCTFGGGGKLDILEALKYEYPHYFKEFNKKRIKGRLITSGENKKVMQKIYKSRVDIKTLPNLKSRVSFTLFKNKSVIYSAKEKPFVIVIDDKEISNALKDYFERLWVIIK
ncbi:hypothetical protein AYK26_06360 [Euryarchaeota archaeon SM23-78]|nr:MAG: hypothetical protein AYK26_06360 [Euryarchaeota archaeon SM23-78]MBW3001058.1 hypothetical protein [Candidatus Woesearchaeota archaeon]